MPKAAADFDAQTIALLKVALDEAWDRLPPKLQATMLKTTLAERILKSAAEGERNLERLREAALRDLAVAATTKMAFASRDSMSSPAVRIAIVEPREAQVGLPVGSM
jgi:hypothetical protein